MNMQTGKNIALALATAMLASGSMSAYAQATQSKKSKHELSVHAGYGIASLFYSLDQGTLALGKGWEAGVGYAYFFTENIGIATGAAVATHSASISGSGITGATTNLVDEYGDGYHLRSTLDGFSESQELMSVNIPLMLQLQGSRRHKPYVRLGVQLSLPIISATYSNTMASVTNVAHYYGWGVDVAGPAYMGLGKFGRHSNSADLDLSFSLLASAEVGIRWALGSNGWALYTGVYADYGLNNAVKDAPFVTSTAKQPSDFAVHSILYAQQPDGNGLLADKVSLVAAGAKLRLVFGKGGGGGTKGGPRINKDCGCMYGSYNY
jgi:hypothetical protein